MKRTDISRLRVNRALYFKISFIVSLAFVILAFNYTADPVVYEKPEMAVELDINDIPIVRTPPEKKPLPPPPDIVTEEIIPDEEVPDFIEEPLPDEISVPDTEDRPVIDTILRNDPTPSKPTPRVEPILEDPYKDVEEILLFAEQMPRFPGCEEEQLSKEALKKCADTRLLKFMSNHIKYPRLAIENSIEGTVVVSFVVEKDGSITDAKILRDIGGGCGKEALRVVRKMPNWIAGKQNGRKVRVHYKLPVKYKSL